MAKYSNKIAVLMLAGMLVLMISSSWNDSATFDEIAHIPSGYTALKYQDSRLNPEHPPLIKDFAALPLLFMNLKFELRPDFWQNPSVNHRQWQAGHALLYEFGNDPDRILFAARLPIMLLSIIFGFLFYLWIKKRYGVWAGLLTLFFFCISPTVLAHSRYVTTDSGAAFGFFLGIVFFLKFLERPDWRRTILLGLVLGTVLMFKFSLISLLLIYGILFLLWIWAFKAASAGPENSLTPSRNKSGLNSATARPHLEFSFPALAAFLGKLIIAGLISIAVIWVVYAYHTWNYPQAQNLSDAKNTLAGYKVPMLSSIDFIDFWLISHKTTRPIGQYLFGFLMTARHMAGGHTTYFLGEVSAKGWWYYFPVIYLLKEQLAFHFLTLAVLFLAVLRIRRGRRSYAALKEWIRANFPLAAGMVFIGVYWAISISNPLNIGVRHVLPTFPFIYFLVSREITIWLTPLAFDAPKTFFGPIKLFYEDYFKLARKYIIIFIILIWMVLNMFLVFPYYLSFYNILAGGINNGYRVATDSNYDWGQDLKRLAARLEENKIDKVCMDLLLDYFGGGSPEYYFNKSLVKYEPWWSAKGSPPAGSYFAVSLNSLAGSQAKYHECSPQKCDDATIKPEDTYPWLKDKTPVARGGMSILIFRID
jgi:hypothetical protein